MSVTFIDLPKSAPTGYPLAAQITEKAAAGRVGAVQFLKGRAQAVHTLAQKILSTITGLMKQVWRFCTCWRKPVNTLTQPALTDPEQTDTTPEKPEEPDNHDAPLHGFDMMLTSRRPKATPRGDSQVVLVEQTSRSVLGRPNANPAPAKQTSTWWPF